jgi:hypothetical protein
VQWLDGFLFGETGLTFVLSGLNTASLAGVAVRARTRARRVGAMALTFLCAGLAFESVVFLAVATSGQWASAWAAAFVLLARTALLLSSGFLTALILRAAPR